VSLDVVFHEDVIPYCIQEEKKSMGWQNFEIPSNSKEHRELQQMFQHHDDSGPYNTKENLAA